MKKDTKKEILLAAARVINEQGVLALTLEQVAKNAGVSKGGLLYHFPSKEALLEGMVSFLTAGFARDMEAAVAGDPAEKGTWTRAYASLSFEAEEEAVALNTAFLSAAAINPQFLRPMVDLLGQIQCKIENDGVDPVVATAIRLAADGMFYNQLYGIHLDKKMEKDVLAYLLAAMEEKK